jgi:methyl-accepting chemotaxis protein
MFTTLLKSGGMSQRYIFAVLLGCTLLLSGCGSDQASAIKIENEVVSDRLDAKNKAVVDSFLDEKKDEVQKLSRQMSIYLNGSLTIDTALLKDSKGVLVPAMMHNGKLLNNDHTIPEMISAETGGGSVATIFVRSGNEFIRISTTLRRTGGQAGDGERATGSMLNHTHPAYNAALNGDTYTGTATLFESIYMTEYQPIKDKTGNVIGIIFVGKDIMSDVVLLRRRMKFA